MGQAWSRQLMSVLLGTSVSAQHACVYGAVPSNCKGCRCHGNACWLGAQGKKGWGWGWEAHRAVLQQHADLGTWPLASTSISTSSSAVVCTLHPQEEGQRSQDLVGAGRPFCSTRGREMWSTGTVRKGSKQCCMCTSACHQRHEGVIRDIARATWARVERGAGEVSQGALLLHPAVYG